MKRAWLSDTDLLIIEASIPHVPRPLAAVLQHIVDGGRRQQPKQFCQVEGCDKPMKARGMCHAHDMKARRRERAK